MIEKSISTDEGNGWYMYNVEEWEKAVAFHGHRCPGLAIGFKAVEAFVQQNRVGDISDEQVVCITENDACGCDAVQALLSCTFGKGNLIYRRMGKMAFNFYIRESGEALRLYFKADNTDRLPREAWMERILNAPADELFAFSKPVFQLPEQARLFQSQTCSVCGEKVREDRVRLEEGKPVCLGCYKEYDR